MLSFDLRTLESEAARVDAVLAADDPVWMEGDRRPADGISVVGRLSGAGEGRYYFSGRIAGEARDECRRCLTDVLVPVDEDLHLLFAASDDETVADSDMYVIDARDRALDLRPALREQWLLAVPPLATCREDCKGLCPTCGADLNAGACTCAPARDPRWDALRSIDEPAR